MVAINNNLGDKFNLIDSKLSADKTDELFAELFALMHSSFVSNEKNQLVKDQLANLVTEKPIPLTEKTIPLVADDKNPELNLDSTETDIDNKNEIELAKSLVQIFYKQFGIDDTEEVINTNSKKKFEDTSKQPNQLAFSKSLKLERINEKIDATKSIDISEVDDSSLNQNLVIKITKEKNSSEKSPTKEKNFNLSKTEEFKIDKESQKPIINLKNSSDKRVSQDSGTNLIKKKSKKKNRQLESSTKENSESNKIHNLSLKEDLKLNNRNIKNNVTADNKINLKKEVKNNDSKLSDNKQSQTNIGGKEFLDLLESSWGEKFSKIIKNSIKNNLNKVEIELKPKNLGKLNLEVSVKNNKTTINLSSENQDVLNILNENLSKFNELIEKENKSFSSLMNNNNQNSNFNKKKSKGDLGLEGFRKKKKSQITEMKKISNHNIDVNA